MLADLRYALRTLTRVPAFSGAAIVAIALGIAANATIFTVARGALGSLPYRDDSRLLAIENNNPKQPEAEPFTSVDDYLDLRQRTRTLESIAAVTPVWNVVVGTPAGAERVEALFVSANFLDMLGVAPAIGRNFRADEDQRGAPRPVVVLSDRYWRERLGADPAIVGRSLVVDDTPRTIVGVLPPRAALPGFVPAAVADQIRLLLPLASNSFANSNRNLRLLKLGGRLRDGVRAEEAGAELRTLWSALVSAFPESNSAYTIGTRPLAGVAQGPVRSPMLFLSGAAGLVLLLVAASVANLLLARATGRRRLFAIRAALGAPASRLLRELLAESWLLAGAGGAIGLLLASWGLDWLIFSGPATLPRYAIDGLGVETLWFGLLLIVATGLAGSIPAALTLARRDLAGFLKDGGRGTIPSAGRLREALVAAEVALAVVLLIATGLLVRSFGKVLSTDPGFQAERVATASTLLSSAYREPAQRVEFWRRLEGRLRSTPGIEEAGLVSRLPMLGSNVGSWILIEGRSIPPGERLEAEYRIATRGYFRAMGVPLKRGRLFEERDDADPRSVTLINEEFARQYFPGEDPVGRRIKAGGNPQAQPWLTVVGVVGNLRHFGLDVAPRPELYRPYLVNPLSAPIVVARGSGDPAALVPAIRRAVREVDGTVPVYNGFSMRELVDRSTESRRFLMLLVSAFGALALAFACVSAYGVVAQAVSARLAEFGIRMALGASPSSVARLVLRLGLRGALAGVAAGTVAGAALSRFASTVVYQIEPLDAASFGTAVLVMVASAALASTLPAIRAARVDPVEALRHE